MTPADPTTGLETLPAPLAFIGGVLALLVWLTRELRGLLRERNADQAAEIKALREDVEQLTAEVERLRDDAVQDARDAHTKHIDLIRQNAALLTLLATHGIDPYQETS